MNYDLQCAEVIAYPRKSADEPINTRDIQLGDSANFLSLECGELLKSKNSSKQSDANLVEGYSLSPLEIDGLDSKSEIQKTKKTEEISEMLKESAESLKTRKPDGIILEQAVEGIISAMIVDKDLAMQVLKDLNLTKDNKMFDAVKIARKAFERASKSEDPEKAFADEKNAREKIFANFDAAQKEEGWLWTSKNDYDKAAELLKNALLVNPDIAKDARDFYKESNKKFTENAFYQAEVMKRLEDKGHKDPATVYHHMEIGVEVGIDYLVKNQWHWGMLRLQHEAMIDEDFTKHLILKGLVWQDAQLVISKLDQMMHPRGRS